uniref:Uncharacterized protein n=1 Tax=Pipistrellus kuhlii TaxID=59472 RepID=A0A7J7VN92_PIPKU|nr:hypothetical protein mPipKuh1_008421 [Pipistrellus kuhlii]
MLVCDMDNNGSLNTQVIHQLGPGLRSKMAIQTQQSKLVNWQVDGEYRDSNFTAAITLGNPDILVGPGVLVAHFLQSIMPCLALGGELVYHRRPGEEGTVMTLAGKYTLNNWLATVTLGQAGMHVTNYHKASDQLQAGMDARHKNARHECLLRVPAGLAQGQPSLQRLCGQQQDHGCHTSLPLMLALGAS